MYKGDSLGEKPQIKRDRSGGLFNCFLYLLQAVQETLHIAPVHLRIRDYGYRVLSARYGAELAPPLCPCSHVPGILWRYQRIIGAVDEQYRYFVIVKRIYRPHGFKRVVIPYPCAYVRQVYQEIRRLPFQHVLYIRESAVRYCEVDIRLVFQAGDRSGRSKRLPGQAQYRYVGVPLTGVAVDVIVAPIADNRMFDIINEFVENEITDEQCRHSLAATNLGYQYVLKTKKAVDSITYLQEMFVCSKEKKICTESRFSLINNGLQKVKMARIEYKNKGRYIEEILK